MTITISGVTVSGATSPVLLLLHADGTDQSSTFIDSSTFSKNVVRRPAANGLLSPTSVDVAIGTRDILFANGQFVIVSNSHAITSVDGINWTTRPLGTSLGGASAYGMAYGAGVYVTLGNSSNKAAYSTDTITWQQSILPQNTGWDNVKYGNGVFVAKTSGNTYCATSSDGINWVQRTTSFSGGTKLGFGAGLFVFVGNNSRTPYTSPDGITWTPRTNALSLNFSNGTTGTRSVEYGGGYFVLSTYCSSGSISYTASSPDGIVWTESSFPSARYWYALTYAGDRWIAANYYNIAESAVSYDSLHWYAGPVLAGAGGNWIAAAYGNNTTVIGNIGVGRVEVISSSIVQTEISTAQSKFGGASAWFKGGNDGLVISPGSSLNFRDNDFTIELFARFNVLPPSGRYEALITKGWDDIIQTRYGFFFGIGNNSGTYDLGFYKSTDGLVGTMTSTSKTWAGAAINTWVHLAVVRYNNTITCYINGVPGTSTSFTGSIYASDDDVLLGIDQSATSNITPNCYMDEIRISDVAQYTTTFTAPTSPFTVTVPPLTTWITLSNPLTPTDPYFENVVLLLHGDGADGSTTFIDSSTAPKVFTSAGGTAIRTAQSKFGGASIGKVNGSYLTGPFIDIISSSFCIEMFLYVTQASAGYYTYLVCQDDAFSSNQHFQSMVGPTGTVAFIGFSTASRSSAWSVVTAADVVPFNTWKHIAYTYDGTTMRIFVDGVLEASSNKTLYSAGTRITEVGKCYYTYGGYYIDDLRITKGVARYTTDFTPPSAAFPDYLALYNTVLPAVTGSAQVGSTLTCSSGTWTGSPSPIFYYQWMRGSTLVGDNSSTYLVTISDVGNSMMCVITASNIAESVSAYSNSTALVTAGNDPYFENVVLLLHGNGPDGGTVFIDSSISQKAITRYGSSTTTTTVSKFDGSSIFINGNASGSYLTTPNNTDFSFGSEDFTVELWANFRSGSRIDGGYGNTNQELLSFWSNLSGPSSWCWELVAPGPSNTSVPTSIAINFNGTGFSSFAHSFVEGTWYHIAVSRNSNTVRMFLDGALKATTGSAPTIASTVPVLSIGAVSAPTTWFLNAYLDDIRITKGVGRYLAAFPPITTSFPNSTIFDPYRSSIKLLVHANGLNGSTAFKDDSPSPYVITRVGSTVVSTTRSKIGGASMYNGTAQSGNCLKVGNTTTPFQLAADFTMECWVYQTANTEYDFAGLITKIDTSSRASGTTSAFELGMSYTVGNYYPLVNVFWTSTAQYYLGRGLAAPLNTWNHIALVRSGNTLSLYVNGALSNSTTVTGVGVSVTSQMMIGASSQSGNPRHSLPGYMDEVCITNGVARYTAPFTPPTTAYPNV